VGSGATTGITFGEDGTGLDIKFFGDTASAYMLWDQSADSLVFAGGAKMAYGASGTELSYTAGSPIFTLYATSSNSTSTNAEPFYVYSIMSAANGYGGRSRFHAYKNVTGGTNFMGLKSYAEFGSAGRIAGLAAGFCSEIKVANANLGSGGGYAGIEIEYVAGGASTVTAGNPAGNYATWMFLGNSGDANGDFDDNGFFFSAQGLTAGATKLLSTNSQTLKVAIGANTRYLVMSQTENGFGLGTSVSTVTVTAGTPIVSVYSTCASTGTDGTPVYISHTLSAAGGVGVGLQTNVGVTLAGGNYVAALYGVLTFATAGRITGIASGVVGEVVLSAGTTQGTYCGLNSELVANSAVSSGAATAFFYCNIAGSNSTGKTTLNTNGYLFYLGAGVVDTASGLFDTFSEITPKAIASLRILIGGVPYYIAIHDEADFAD